MAAAGNSSFDGGPINTIEDNDSIIAVKDGKVYNPNPDKKMKAGQYHKQGSGGGAAGTQMQ